MVFPFRELLGKLVILPGDFYPPTDSIISGTIWRTVKIQNVWSVIMLLVPRFNKFLSIRYSQNV